MLVSGSGCPPPGNGFTKSAKPRHWFGFSFKIKKIAPALGHVLSSIHFLGRFLTEEYVNLHRNQVSPALGRIFITYMVCPGFGFGNLCENLPRLWALLWFSRGTSVSEKYM